MDEGKPTGPVAPETDVVLQGLKIKISNPRGSVRNGIGADGKPWSVTMPADYGYVKGTEGADGDQVDVYVGPNPESTQAFIINQNDADTGKFDEHKVMLGFLDQQAALAAYRAGFSDGRAEDRLGAIKNTTIEGFKAWLAGGKTDKPVAKLPELEAAALSSDEQLYDEQQALLRKLPNDIGKAKREGTLTAAQKQHLARVDEIEKLLPTDSKRYRDIYNRRVAERDAKIKAESDDRRKEALRKLEAAGFKEGDDVYQIARHPLNPAASLRINGTVKIGKDGVAYVSYSGKRYGLSGWFKEKAAPEAAPTPTPPAPADEIVRSPPGYTLENATLVADPEEARIKGGKYTAVARRATPWGSERGYGDTPEAAQRDALARISKPLKPVPAQDSPAMRAMALEIYDLANKHNFKATDAELRAAAEMAISDGVEPLDALRAVLERAAIETADEIASATGEPAPTQGAEDATPSGPKPDDTGTGQPPAPDTVAGEEREPAEPVAAPATKRPPERPQPESEPEAAAPESVEQTAIRRLIDMVRAHLNRHRAITVTELQRLAEAAYGGALAEGKFDRKDMYDALEAGTNAHFLWNAEYHRDTDAAVKEVAEKVRALIEKLPTQTVRTEEQVRFQQFSTPPDYALAVVHAANIEPMDIVLEPSAGTGNLAVWASIKAPKELIVNELSDRRRDHLGYLGADVVLGENAEQLNGIWKGRQSLNDIGRPTVIIMNPPFSQTAGRMGDKKVLMTAANHIEEAMKLLAANGRLVAIVGRGMDFDAPTYRDWFQAMSQKYAFRANIGVDGAVYRKYGTDFGTRVLVIDKVPPDGTARVVTSVANVPELIEALKDVRETRIPVGERAPDQPAIAPVVEPAEGGLLPKPRPVSGDIGAVGTERDEPADAVGGGPLQPSDVDRPDTGERPVGGKVGDELADDEPERGGRPEGAGGGRPGVVAGGGDPGGRGDDSGGRGGEPDAGPESEVAVGPQPPAGGLAKPPPGLAKPAPLRIENYGSSSIIIKGETRENIGRIKNAVPGVKPRWKAREVGWVFPKAVEAEVRKKLAHLLGPPAAPTAPTVPTPAPEPELGKGPAWWEDLTVAGRFQLVLAAGWSGNRAETISKTAWRHMDPNNQEVLERHVQKKAQGERDELESEDFKKAFAERLPRETLPSYNAANELVGVPIVRDFVLGWLAAARSGPRPHWYTAAVGFDAYRAAKAKPTEPAAPPPPPSQGGPAWWEEMSKAQKEQFVRAAGVPPLVDLVLAPNSWWKISKIIRDVLVSHNAKPTAPAPAPTPPPETVPSPTAPKEPTSAEDIEKIINDVLGEKEAEAPAPAPETAKRPVTPQVPAIPGTTPLGAKPTAKVVKDVLIETAKGIDDVTKGLSDLFGGGDKGRLGAGPSFDEETYAKAKPLFISGVQHFKAAGENIAELIRRLIGHLRASNFTDEVIRRMTPYITRFIQDVQTGKVSLDDAPKIESADPTKQTGDLSDKLFENYTPQRLKIAGSQPHPGQLVQSSAMASVLPPLPTYQPKLPVAVVTRGDLSIAQLEPVVYAGQAHTLMLPTTPGSTEYRRGFFIGDGTGVGKGRIAAGIILDNWMQGRKKAVWLSEKQTLFEDATRDWTGLGQDKDVLFSLSKTKLGNAIQAAQGILFTTYDTMKVGNAQAAQQARGGFPKGTKVQWRDSDGKDVTGVVGNAVKGTANEKRLYVNVILPSGDVVQVAKSILEKVGTDVLPTRLTQIINWLGPDFEGVILFDEAHNMANAVDTIGGRGVKKASAKALAGVDLQRLLPKARVVYMSATGATEVDNLAYMDRLGLWGTGTPFTSRPDFVSQIEDGGISAMELVARDLKALGSYISRNLSYDDVEYSSVLHTLTGTQREIYDTAAEAWQLVLRHIEEALVTTGQANNAQARNQARSQFWGGLQRFFNQVISSMQMPSVLKEIAADLKAGRQAVVQLTSTQAAQIERAAAKATSEEDFEDFDLTPLEQLLELVMKVYPVQQYEDNVDHNGNVISVPVVDSEGNPVLNPELVAERDALIERLSSIKVPTGPLDLLLDHFGIDVVAEVTGRTRRFVRKFDQKKGEIRRQEDKRSGSANIEETNAFQDGRKKILVFSQAGGTGRSYHADVKSASKDARRVHYLVQAGWRADIAVQGFGRTHRSNQASAPIFRLVTTDLKGQKRFISSIARRLSQLGALTKGERQAADQGAFNARDNLESTEAKDALWQLYRNMHAGLIEGMTIEQFQYATGLRLLDQHGGLLSQVPGMLQFLNRLLALKFDQQNAIFEHLEDLIDHIVEQKRQNGTLDVGLETLRADRVEKVSEQTVYTHPETGAETKYVRLTMHNKTRPRGFAQANERRGGARFFVKNIKSEHVYAVTEASTFTNADGSVIERYRLEGPINDHMVDKAAIDERGKDAKWHRYATLGEAEAAWNEALKKVPDSIAHDLPLITGVILPIWNRLRGDPRIVRTMTEDGERLLGRVIPPSQLAQTLENLGAHEETPFLSTQQMVDALLSGATLRLANDWELKRRTVAGETRIELSGVASFGEGQQVIKEGLFREVIASRPRYFVPTGDEAATVMETLTKFRPVVKVTSGTGRLRRGELRANRAERGTERTESNLNSAMQRFQREGYNVVQYDQVSFSTAKPDNAVVRALSLKTITDLLKRIVGKTTYRVNIVDHLWVLNADGTLEEVSGIFVPGDNAVAVSLSSLDVAGTIRHEAVHMLREVGAITPAAWSILENKARTEWRERFEIDRRYVSLDEDALNEEAVAEAAAAWGRGELRAPPGIRRLLQLVHEFIEALRNLVTTGQFRTALGILREMEEGAFAEGGPGLRGGRARFASAWHGSPHDYDKPSTAKINTGEGAQFYGWGLYFTDLRRIAEHYRDKLTGRAKSTVRLKLDGQEVSLDQSRQAAESQTAWWVLRDIQRNANENLRINSAADHVEDTIERYERELADLQTPTGATETAKRSVYEDNLIDKLHWLKKNKDRIDYDMVEPPKGKLYKVELSPTDDQYLLWDKKVSEQSPIVRDAIRSLVGDTVRPDIGIIQYYVENYQHHLNDLASDEQFDETYTVADFIGERVQNIGVIEKISDFKYKVNVEDERVQGAYFVVSNTGEVLEKYHGDTTPIDLTTGATAYRTLALRTSDKQASLALLAAGVRGNKYLTGASRRAGEGDFNYVIFDEADVTITAKFQRVRGTQAQEAVIERIMDEPDDRSLPARARAWYDDIRADLWRRLRQGLFDDFASIGEWEKSTNAGQLLDASRSAYKQALRTRNLDGVMYVVSKFGALRYNPTDGVFETIPGSQSFEDVFQPVIQNGLLHLWKGWAIANRAERLKAEGRENLLSDADILALKDIDQQHLIGGRNVFRETMDNWRAFNKAHLDMAEDAGLINAQQRSLWENYDYVPFYRILDDAEVQGPQLRGGIEGQRSGIRRLTGGTEKIGDLIENMFLNTAKLVDASFKNVAMVRTVELLDQTGAIQVEPRAWKTAIVPAPEAARRLSAIGVNVDQLDPAQRDSWLQLFQIVPPRDPGVVSFMRAGKVNYRRVNDPLLLRSLTALNPTQIAGIMNLLRFAKRTLTTFVTLDPAFMLANAIRDTLSAWVTTDTGLRPGFDTVNGFVKAVRESPELVSIMAAGGGAAGYYRTTAEGVRAALHERLPGVVDRRTIVDSAKKAWRLYQRIGAASEQANRIAIYDRMLARGATKAEAIHQSQDLLNFGMRGDFAVMRFLAETVPFMNARLQGLYRLGRGAVEHPIGFTLKGAVITAATMALLAVNSEDDRYRDLPEWDKDTYFHIWVGGEHFRIPKPFEVGAIFATVPERIVNLWLGNDTSKVFAKRMLAMFTDTFALNPTPQLFAPIVEQWANRDMFLDRPIVSQSLQDLRPSAQQFTPRTSTTAKLVGAVLPEAAGPLASPVRIEHAVNGYFGTIGSYILAASDAVLDAAMDKPSAPAKRIDQLPVVRRFYRDDPALTSKWINEFYDLRAEVDGLYRSLNAMKRRGDGVEAMAFTKEHFDKLRLRPGMENAYQALLKIGQYEKAIYADRRMTADEKRVVLDQLTARRLDMVKRSVRSARASSP